MALDKAPCEPLDINYVAGLFDGEGSVSLTRRTNKLSDGFVAEHWNICLSLAQSNKGILERVRATFGSGNVCKHSSAGTRNGITSNFDCFQIMWGNAAAYETAKMLIPICVIKKPQLILVTDFYDKYHGYTRGFSKWRNKNPEYFLRAKEQSSAAQICRQKLKEVRNAA